MPTKPLNPRRNLHQLDFGREIHQPLDEVKAYAAHAGLMELSQIGVGDAALHGSDAPCATAARGTGVDDRAVVSAVTSRLHDDVARKP